MKSKNNLTHTVANTMEEWIASGKWGMNERIPTETELIALFNVSRNTLREAIRGLAQAGLLEIKQGNGTFVRAQSRLQTALWQASTESPLQDTIAVRLALESLAAKLAAKHRTEAQMQHIRDCFLASQQAENQDAFLMADLDFHLSIVAASQNTLLIQIYQQIVTAVEANISAQLTKNECPLAHMHQELFNAIVAQNENAAEAAVISSMQRLKDAMQ